MKRLIHLIIVSLIALNVELNAQNTTLKGDSILITLNGYKGGQIQWQTSIDSLNWSDIVEIKTKDAVFLAKEKLYYRAKVMQGNCIYYSDVTPVNVFDFKVTDEKGDSIFSKTSEYLILLPDIQNYISYYENNIFLQNILNWVLNFNSLGFKVKTVIQVGDVTNSNRKWEYEPAQKLFSILNNKIDYVFCIGNHDYDGNGNPYNRRTLINEYFTGKNYPVKLNKMQKDSIQNTFYETTINGNPAFILSLEFGPRDKSILWADSIAKVNSDKIGILLTHAYLYKDGERFNYAKYGNIQRNNPHSYVIDTFEHLNDGEEIWQKLVRNNNNIKLVLCGHMTIDYAGNLISKNDADNNVLQMLFDTQDFTNGGNGWFQILEFKRDRKTLKVKTYSTNLNLYGTKAVEDFTFQY
jgi:hypothetical protein